MFNPVTQPPVVNSHKYISQVIISKPLEITIFIATVKVEQYTWQYPKIKAKTG
jgi:hypothetical protein